LTPTGPTWCNYSNPTGHCAPPPLSGMLHFRNSTRSEKQVIIHIIRLGTFRSEVLRTAAETQGRWHPIIRCERANLVSDHVHGVESSLSFLQLLWIFLEVQAIWVQRGYTLGAQSCTHGLRCCQGLYPSRTLLNVSGCVYKMVKNAVPANYIPC